MKIAVVGAGILGRYLAWHLTRSGMPVHLFEAEPVNLTQRDGAAAAFTAAGMIAPYSESDILSHELMLLGQRSLELWYHAAKSLSKDIGFSQRGSLIIAHSQDMADLHFYFRKLMSHDICKTETQWLRHEDLIHLENELSAFHEAVVCRREAHVNPTLALNALLENALNYGLQLHDNCSVDKTTPFSIHIKEKTLHFDYVIDCRGLGAKSQMFGLRGVRGDVIHIHAPEVTIQRVVRLIHPRQRIYIVPRADHHYVIGATEIESEHRSSMSVHSALTLLNSLYSVHPGFSEASIVDMKTNFRPAFIDNHPKVEHEPGLVRANGLFRHGILFAPALAESIATDILCLPKAPITGDTCVNECTI